jgi:hypothetical protein
LFGILGVKSFFLVQAAAAAMAAGFSVPTSLFNPLMSPMNNFYSNSVSAANASAFSSLHHMKTAFPGKIG